ncbi:hypothetical protein HMPREF0765_2191 [Sphingobacterium spiritivorum ATCC 33300]|uniref:Uncharacterized protein n=1 Tax=Sphingobacterium spiritivorum ATCC 33300 TaxID=525372 RepID=C2FXY5_SPHSI|nr:hypothetical protein HMPREF0765_2191 [Sphingobacterium spiritivorum ATCC 33300]
MKTLCEYIVFILILHSTKKGEIFYPKTSPFSYADVLLLFNLS